MNFNIGDKVRILCDRPSGAMLAKDEIVIIKAVYATQSLTSYGVTAGTKYRRASGEPYSVGWTVNENQIEIYVKPFILDEKLFII